MAIRRAIKAIGLAGILVGALIGCEKNYSYYDFEGKIGEDEVLFKSIYHFPKSNENVLTVKKPNGRIISYLDRCDGDLKLEWVIIMGDKKGVLYSVKDEVGKPILEEAQKQFDNYLKQIKEIRTNQGLENLK